MLISLIAGVAGSYFLLRDLDKRYDIAARTLKTRHKSTQLVSARFAEGTVPRLDLNQAQIQEAQAALELAVLERQVMQAENLLNVLLGRNPGPVARGASIEEQVIPPEVPAGSPSELLERRPDVRAAEQALAAQTARIGVAEALRFPSLKLTADAGYASVGLSSATSGGSSIWAIGANFFAPLFNAGQNKRRVEIEMLVPGSC